MLPAWATIVLALGGSALTAASALIAVRVESARAQDEQWRKLVFDTASTFAETASRAERTLLRSFGARLPELLEIARRGEDLPFAPDVEHRLAELDDLHDSLNIAWDRLSLAIGLDSDAREHASDVLDHVRDGTFALSRRASLAVMDEAIALSDSNQAFQRAANLMLHRPPKLRSRRFGLQLRVRSPVVVGRTSSGDKTARN